MPREKSKRKPKKSMSAFEHKETLQRLQQTDPKFYEFLKEQDAELLDFDVSDVEDNKDEDAEDVEEEEMIEDESEGGVDEDEHGTSSDESHSVVGPDDYDREKISLSAKHTRSLQTNLTKILEGDSDAKKAQMVLNRVVEAFRAVVTQAGGRPDKQSQYRIEDATDFNSVIRLCFSAFPTLWIKISGADVSSLSQGRQKKLRPYVKPYLHNLSVFLQEVQNADALEAVLKHLTRVADYYSLFGTLSRQIVKILVGVWSTKNEAARILAFVSLTKLVRGSPEQLASIALKKMYLSYVKGTKLVTPSTWPVINFMQRSYAEICGVYKQLAYQYAFIYIRQLAIHLRNAITVKKKDQIKALYNWQFVQCLYLWARVLSLQFGDDSMRQLIYPLIQTALGCATLIPTAKYFPLRLHCVRAILVLIRETGVYAAVLPVVLEVFQSFDFNKKHLRQSLKPFDFDCLLKLSQSQLQESAFKVGVVEAALEVVLEIMYAYANSSAFPELAFVCRSRLKSFQQSCRIPSLSRPVKELMDKISEHAAWLVQRRSAAELNLANTDNNLADFESGLASCTDSPLRKYYEIFKTMKERERKLKRDTAIDEEEEPESDEETKRPKKKRKLDVKKQKDAKTAKREIPEYTESTDKDMVKDLNLSDLDE